jgi:hypothetical protein
MLTTETHQSEYKPLRSLSLWLIGRPLQTADAPEQTIGKVIGPAVFVSDALLSTAYATQEILGVLSVTGSLSYDYVFPISIANETITIVVPQFIPSKRWHNALHMRTGDYLRQELLSKPGSS